MSNLYFRPNTWDSNIWHSIVDNNEYGIRDNWPFYFIDIGGHIGSFSYFMMTKKGATKGIVIEPDSDNYNVLTHNLKPYIENNALIALNAGIGLPDHKLCMHQSAGANTGGIYYIPSNDGNISTIQLDDIINLIAEKDHQPILLKLDCEGCEYEALESCSQLHKISCIVGEFHVRNTRNELTLKTLLESQNFAFAYHHTGPDIGLFGAHKLV